MADLRATLFIWRDGRMLAQCSVDFSGEAKRALEQKLAEIGKDLGAGKPVILGPEWKVVPL